MSIFRPCTAPCPSEESSTSMSSKRPSSTNAAAPLPKRPRGFRAVRTSSSTATTQSTPTSTRQVFVTVETQTGQAGQLRGPLRAQTRILSNEPEPPSPPNPPEDTRSTQNEFHRNEDQPLLNDNTVDEEPITSSQRLRHTKNIVSN